MPLNQENKQQQLTLALGRERQVYQVRELAAAVQSLFEQRFGTIWVAGEISGCKLSASGHYYFTLKDREAQLRCVLFKGALRWAKFRPQDGLSVIARGTLDLYGARGDLQLLVESLEPQGAGALQVAFEELKKRLAGEGLFEAARKRALPRLPRRIGIVTSPAGAAVHDFLQVLERRFPGLEVRIYPVLVQGEGSVEQICAGLRHFSGGAWAEVVVLARGGGSLEDLWSFNEEAVARQVAASVVPVISAIGHETDFTICDFVADLRAPTPSAAAELVVCTRQSLLEQIAACRAKILQGLRYGVLRAYRKLENSGAERSGRILLRGVTRRCQAVDEADGRLRTQMARRTGEAGRRLAELTARLSQTDLRLRVARSQHRRHQLAARLERWKPVAEDGVRVSRLEIGLMEALRSQMERRGRRLERAEAHLLQLSPLAVLGRGYAIVEDSSSRVVRVANEMAAGEKLRVRLSRGALEVTVDSYTES